MSFDGRDYNQAFEEACEELPYVRDRDEIMSRMLSMEWILWEAIRGVFFLTSVVSGIFMAWLISLVLPEEISVFTESMISITFVLIWSLSGYWLLRFVFWYEISRHVMGREFGDPLQHRD